MGPGEVLDLHTVGAHRSDSLEVLRDLMHQLVGRKHAAAPVELLGEENVLGHPHRVLEQAMDEDHVDADELSPSLDVLHCDLANVRVGARRRLRVGDELQLQLAGTPSPRRSSPPLKKALVNRRSWPSRLELQSAVFGYIEAFYNRQRHHSTLGMPSRSRAVRSSQSSIRHRTLSAPLTPRHRHCLTNQGSADSGAPAVSWLDLSREGERLWAIPKRC
jgi:hypothetical protein